MYVVGKSSLATLQSLGAVSTGVTLQLQETCSVVLENCVKGVMELLKVAAILLGPALMYVRYKSSKAQMDKLRKKREDEEKGGGASDKRP